MSRMLRDQPVRSIAQPVHLSVGMVVAGWLARHLARLVVLTLVPGLPDSLMHRCRLACRGWLRCPP
jgi:hypothetical protein